MKLNTFIDHTLLKATATPNDVKKLCEEAISYKFYAVCVNGYYVSLAKEELKNSPVKIASVIGFPLGANSTASKVDEAYKCVKDGADEIDMVINLGLLKQGLYKQVANDIAAVKMVIDDKILKVIIETCYLTEEEKRTACRLTMEAGADFVKTSTGFGTGGATLADVRLMKEVVGDTLKIKASGGIKDAETARKYIDCGVTRIGTSSGIAIVSQ